MTTGQQDAWGPLNSLIKEEGLLIILDHQATAIDTIKS
jgi:hypothetical protein